MDFRFRHLLLTLVVLAAPVLPGAAAASPAAVVRDCAEDGSLEGSYSDEDKRAALGQIPADLDEYSDCRAVISGAVGSGGGGVRASASSSEPSAGDAAPGVAPARKAATRRAERRRRETSRRERSRDRDESRPMSWRRQPERVLDSFWADTRRPGVVTAADSASDIPLPLMAGLIALVVLWLAVGALLLWRPPAVDGAINRLISGR